MASSPTSYSPVYYYSDLLARYNVPPVQKKQVNLYVTDEMLYDEDSQLLELSERMNEIHLNLYNSKVKLPDELYITLNKEYRRLKEQFTLLRDHEYYDAKKNFLIAKAKREERLRKKSEEEQNKPIKEQEKLARRKNLRRNTNSNEFKFLSIERKKLRKQRQKEKEKEKLAINSQS